MVDENQVYDITFIGAGPVALFGAYYAGFRQMKVKLIDTMPDLGGQVTALYPEKEIFDVAGFPMVLGKELVKNLVKQGLQYGATVCLEEKVQKYRQLEEKLFELETDKGKHWTRTICLTVGLGTITPRPLGHPSEARLLGKGVTYGVKALDPFRGKECFVIGGGDSAFDWVLMLRPVAKKVWMVHRRDGFRAHEDSVKKVMGDAAVEKKLFFEVKDIHGADRVEGITIFDNRTKAEERHDADAVVLSLGFISSLGPIAEWGLETIGKSLVVNTRMETNKKGIYAAGDCIEFDGKLRLIATGFGEAAMAVCQAKHWIDPKSQVFPGHSSSLMEEKKEKEKLAAKKAEAAKAAAR